MSGADGTAASRISRRRALRGAGVVGVGAALGLAGRAGAQDATPSAGGWCPYDPTVGDVFTVVGPEGTEIALITVAEVQDPFETYDPSAPPQVGQRYVVVRLAVEATGPRPLRVDPSGLFVQDAEGFVYRPTSIRLTEDTTDVVLAFADLASGSRVEGIVAFSVIRAAQLARLFYQPQSDRLLMLADLRA